eukprot:15284-Prymnesium_polylepis.1
MEVVTPSAWTERVKAMFKRHGNVPLCPKDTRSSFITFLRSGLLWRARRRGGQGGGRASRCGTPARRTGLCRLRQGRVRQASERCHE